MKEKKIKVSIHQPDFLSYIGFFNKINKSDIFVILDDVRMSKSGWTHRDQIKTINGTVWLTIPIKKIKNEKKIRLTEINNNNNWKSKHLNLIYENYKKAQFFDETFDMLKEIYSFNTNKLIEFNLNSIKKIFKILNIKKKIIFLSDLNVNGEKNELLINILNKLEAKYYLSGDGARNFLDIEKFYQNGLKIVFNKFKHPVYNQLHGEFVCNLSIIDIFFNCGVEKTKQYLNYD